MSDHSAVETPAPTALSEHLQQITEALAAATTQDDILRTVLSPALIALSALAGVVLLVDSTGQQLQVAATAGHEASAQLFWQDGPLDGNGPVSDALERQQALFFEQQGELAEAYPELAQRVGATSAVATAILPMFLDGRPLGSVILDFKEPHPFSVEEKRFLQTLAAQCAGALGRLNLLTQLRHQLTENEALNAFALFTEAAADTTNVEMLVAQAVNVLLSTVGDVSVAYYELQGDTWRVKALSDDFSPQYLALIHAGFPEHTLRFENAVLARRPVFVTGWEPVRAGFPAEPRYGAIASYPYFLPSRPLSLLSIGAKGKMSWTPSEENIIRAVGRSFGLALERALQTQQLQQRNAELDIQTQSLDAFMAYSEAVGTQSDVSALSQHAFSLLKLRFPNFSCGYYTLQDEVWKLQVHTDDLYDSPELLAVLRAGLPKETPALAEVLRSQQAVFTDAWDPDREQIENSSDYGTGASYPLVQAGTVGAVLAIGLKAQSHWSPRDKAVFMAVGHGMNLALERASSMQRMQLQKAEAESRNHALEVFSTLTGVLDVRLDRYELIRRTQELVLTLLPPRYAAYWEPEDGFWRLKVQVGDAGQPALQAAIDSGFPVGATPTLDIPMNTSEPYFIDVYDKATDIDPEVAGHLNAGACLPVFIRGRFVGIFNLSLFDTRVWDATDRAVLISAVQSLTLALEGAQSLAELAQQATELAQQATELAHQTTELEASNSSLQAANEELEAFTYSASHDLRTPVRHVMGFAELAEKALSDTPNAKAQQYLSTVKQAATRMTSLIDGMLLLSRSGRQEFQVQPVELNALVIQARRDVEMEFKSRPVCWQIGDLPTVQGDREMLQQVLTNLLSNAVKYSARQEMSEVRVWCESSASEWAICVEDNGIGFDAAYSKKLFGIFQRLHSEKEFKGTGVGLATVKRIVQKHGGQVFAESDGEHGATFGFSLPRPH